MHHQKYHSALRSAAKYRMMSTGDAGGGAEIEYPRGSHHDVYRRSCQLAQMGNRIRRPDRRLCHRGAALQKGVPRRQLGTETGHRKEQGPSKRLWRTSTPPVKYPAMIGTLPTTTRSTARSGSIPPISSIHRHRPCTCISIMSMILTSCSPVRSTTTKTTKGCSCFRSSFCPGSWPASPSSSWA